jgi:hypothetical protein
MWELLNRTAFAAERAFARDATGAEYWLVAVRATFSFDDQGALTLAPVQKPVKLAPEYMGELGKSSLRHDSDLPRTKTTTDILLHATAYAPGKKAVTELLVEFAVGPISKRLRVVGDRHYTSDGVSAAAPFTRMPIRYERAYGGVDAATGVTEARNPIGVGASVKEGDALPNIEAEAASVGTEDWKNPVGFGPLAAHWSPRLELAGTYDNAWEKSRKPLVPSDFDERSFQCAPADQQTPKWLRGGELVSLQGLTPEGSTTFELPQLTLGFDTTIGKRIESHPGRLHSVIIDADERTLGLVWHTSLRCHGELHALRSTTVFEKVQLTHD